MKLIRTQLSPETPFGFTCNCCLRCCRDKRIQLNPYETARLAANRGISTTEFIAQFTTSNGTYLVFTDKGACVFLDSGGCGVHPDRPLVCRLYPLGRHVSGSGVETFSELEREDGCEGLYGTAGVISRYLEEQKAGPYIEAADRYLELFWKLTAFMQTNASDPGQRKYVRQAARRFKDGFGQEASSWMDMDAAVMKYCTEKGKAFPEDVGQKMALHIKAVETWIK
ncbi:MAG: YkgJ family cysteine cluster protein [Thermodesulfovibrionales bacterium]